MDAISFHIKRFYVYRKQSQHEFEEMLFEAAKSELQRVGITYVKKIVSTYRSIIEDAHIAHMLETAEVNALKRRLQERLLKETKCKKGS